MAFKPITFEESITFTRPLPADYEDQNGDMQTAPANVPRFGFTDGAFDGMLVDSSLNEELGITGIENFSTEEGAFILEAELGHCLPFPGAGFDKILSGKGKIYFVYANGVGKCYANGALLYTVDPITVSEPSDIVTGGAAKILDCKYWRGYLSDITAKQQSAGAFSVEGTWDFEYDWTTQEYRSKNDKGGLKFRTFSEEQTLTRSSDAHFLGPSGDYVTYAPDEPAFEWDPQGNPLGIATEDTAVNVLTTSPGNHSLNDHGSQTTGGTFTERGVLFQTVVPDNGSGVSNTPVPGFGFEGTIEEGKYRIQFLVKSNGIDNIVLRRSTTNVSQIYLFYFNLATQELTTDYPDDVEVEDLGDGLFYFSVSFDSVSSNTYNGKIYYLGAYESSETDGTNGFSVGNVQIEKNDFVSTSWITSQDGQTSTRERMLFQIDDLDNRDWWVKDKGTVYIRVNLRDQGLYSFALWPSGNSNYLMIFGHAGGILRFVSRNHGGTVYLHDVYGVSIDQTLTVAFSWDKTTGYLGTSVAGETYSETGVDFNTVDMRMRIGCSNPSVGTANALFKKTYYKSVVSDMSQLTALTSS